MKLPLVFEDEILHPFFIRVFQDGKETDVEVMAATLNDAIDQIDAEFGPHRSIVV